MELIWHSYKYFPYERDLAIREIESVLNPVDITVGDKSVLIRRPKHPELVDRLVYFSEVSGNPYKKKKTKQALLERVNGNGVNRQSTRYSAHGLHEYKGKFNPQIAKVILNMFSAEPGQIALDPFCGSGTSLVECAHLGVDSIGADINPLAVFIANAKLRSLSVSAERILSSAKKCISLARRSRKQFNLDDDRGEYLRSWFPPEYLRDIERLKRSIELLGGSLADILLVIASNLLRDYSLQEPKDLRIRRRKSPFPNTPFLKAYESAVEAFCKRLSESQKLLGKIKTNSRAYNLDIKNIVAEGKVKPDSVDLVLTSPPYAMALPYIDTQRLSLVWLGLLKPSEILPLEAELIGSREIRGAKYKKKLLKAMEENEEQLPEQEVEFCHKLQSSLTKDDGFRRQLVPRLLYRYFAGMSRSFLAIRELVKDGSPFGLIVGGNHTVLGGKRFDIDTPGHLANIAMHQGWEHVETIPLQTYHRYGLHANNATTTEALVILRAKHVRF